jgi:fatty-acyl-CoA synthase
VAVVVPRHADDAPTLEELRLFGEAQLARYKLPERIRVVNELPLNATHKLDRLALAAVERDAS